MAEWIKWVECPRDAMQGWKKSIPTELKVEYLQKLLEVGFDTIDCGSFVSAKSIPQMADTSLVLQEINTAGSNSKLLCIIANERGAMEASAFDNIHYLGFPFSVSPTFQQRNTNSSMEQSWDRVLQVRDICVKTNKQLVIYLSMGFGNPYGDVYNKEIVFEWADKMVDSGVRIISVADTVGLAIPEEVYSIMKVLIDRYPAVEFGVHLHSTKANWKEKIDAALLAGCLRFDGALKGIGGCPMANDELVGNMDTELVVPYFLEKNIISNLNMQAFSEAADLAGKIFN